MKAEERLIVALDVENQNDVEKIVYELSGLCWGFKVGPVLFIKYGPKIIEYLKEKERRIFLDIKLNDIPNTVSIAVEHAVSLGVDIITVHSLGGFNMLLSANKKKKNCLLFGVTILTSLDQDDLKKMGFSKSMDDVIINLARLSKAAGLDGVIASAKDARLIKNACGDNFLIASPGIRLDFSKDDQKRKQTPDFAIRNGCDYIIVGRPIIKAQSPSDAAKNIIGIISELEKKE